VSDKENLPLDVKLMQLLTVVLLVFVCGFSAWTLSRRFVNSALFDVKYIRVNGDIAHTGITDIRANVSGRLYGTFYTINLRKVKTVFEDIPWVRHAVVRRIFPDTLVVDLQEQHSVAYWGDHKNEQLLNENGVIFSVNLAEVENEHLPTLLGPDSQSINVLAMYRILMPLFKNSNLVISVLRLDELNNWNIVLSNGAVVILDKGTDVAFRVNQFLSTLSLVLSNYKRRDVDLEYADLRYSYGYALRLRGVETKNQSKVGK
jgi:cell division protein FtsQ